MPDHWVAVHFISETEPSVVICGSFSFHFCNERRCRDGRTCQKDASRASQPNKCLRTLETETQTSGKNRLQRHCLSLHNTLHSHYLFVDLVCSRRHSSWSRWSWVWGMKRLPLLPRFPSLRQATGRNVNRRKGVLTRGRPCLHFLLRQSALALGVGAVNHYQLFCWQTTRRPS